MKEERHGPRSPSGPEKRLRGLTATFTCTHAQLACVELTVLGNSSRYLAPLGAGTSYLLTSGKTRLVMDCGNGTSMQLARELGDAKPTGLLVSHFHLDNAADFLPVAFALPKGAPIIVPRGAMARVGDLLRAYSMDSKWLEHVRIVGVGRGDTALVGDLRLDFVKAGHGCPGVATRITGPERRSIVYLGDTGPRAWLADFARGADIILAHTLLLDKDAAADVGRTNLSAGAAGRLARDAGASLLALSHIPFYGDAEQSLAEAKAEFGGEVRLLREAQRVRVD